MMKKIIAVVLIFLLSTAILITGCGSKSGEAQNNQGQQAQQGDIITLKVAHVLSPTHPAQKGLEKFAEILDKETKGKVKVDIYNSGVLGGDTEELQQVISGSLDAAIIMGISIWQGMNPKAGVEELPFLFKNEEMAHKALDGDFGNKIASEVIEPTGVKVLSYWENGLRHFTNSKKPINIPDDMKGIKFRSAESPIRIDMFNTLGASAIPMAFPEVFTGLQQGHKLMVKKTPRSY